MTDAWASVIVKKSNGKILDIEIEPDEESARLRAQASNERLDARLSDDSVLIRWGVARIVMEHERRAIYDGNEFVCITCPRNEYGEHVAWDQAHPTHDSEKDET